HPALARHGSRRHRAEWRVGFRPTVRSPASFLFSLGAYLPAEADHRRAALSHFDGKQPRGTVVKPVARSRSTTRGGAMQLISAALILPDVDHSPVDDLVAQHAHPLVIERI